ncbi:MAG: glycosyltransferase [Planctomycetota bacterium]
MPTPRPVIAHVLHRLDRAGAEVLAAGLARSLRDRYDFHFYCLDGLGPLAEELIEEGFVVASLGREPGIDRAVARRLRGFIDGRGVSLVHAHQYTPFFYSSLARGFSPIKRRRLPILLTEHGRHYPDEFSAKRVLANKLLRARRDRVTAVGGFVMAALVVNEGMRGEVIYNGIEPSSTGQRPTRRDARQALRLEPDAPVVMQVARLHPVKDHATAVRAFAAVHGELPSARLVLIGDGPERETIEQQARALGLSDAVVFTGVRADVRDLLPAADVFLLSSLSEGISVTLLEAMDAGLPIVATQVGGNREVVEQERTGLLAPRGDHAALGRCLLTLLGDPNTAGEYGQAGRRRLLKRFTQDKMHAGYAAQYESLLARSG